MAAVVAVRDRYKVGEQLRIQPGRQGLDELRPGAAERAAHTRVVINQVPEEEIARIQEVEM